MEVYLVFKVLCDIVCWYEELIELLGDGEYFGINWDLEIIKFFYIKYGWLSIDFDGEVFLVVKVWVCVEVSVGLNWWENERVWDEVVELEKCLSVYKEEKEFRWMWLCKNIIVNLRNVEEEWDVCW